MTLGLDHILAFNGALLAAVAAPGPALLYFMRETLASGRRAGLTTAFGLALSASFWTLAALLGLHGIFALFPWAYSAMKIAGAAYLVYIAVATWRSAAAPPPAAPNAAPPERRGWRVTRAFLINIGNPKSVLFAAAVLVVVFPPDLTLASKAFIAANHLATEMAFYAAFAFLLSRRAVGAGYLAAKRRIDRVAALVMGALGLRLAISN